jgi:hypothetical protein
MESTKQVDLTRLNRKQRRNIGTQVGSKIMGRNLPYVKSKWLSLEEFNKQRAKEIAEETKAVDKV